MSLRLNVLKTGQIVRQLKQGTLNIYAKTQYMFLYQDKHLSYLKKEIDKIREYSLKRKKNRQDVAVDKALNLNFRSTTLVL